MPVSDTQTRIIRDVILLVSAILVFIGIIYYINSTVSNSSLNKDNCAKLAKMYTTNPGIISIMGNTHAIEYGLSQFYIKTAYNCCASGKFKNDYVNLCALKTCIQQGVRCLDFEIYADTVNKVKYTPVIAASPVDNYRTKGTYNSIPVEQAFNLINQMAFANGACSNADDPLILHFRIMSNKQQMYNNLANIISKMLTHRLLNNNYHYNQINNFADVPISSFKQKILIFVDSSNRSYQGTDLDEFINMLSNSTQFYLLRYGDLLYSSDLTSKITQTSTETDLQKSHNDFNKTNLTMVLPDWRVSDKNIDYTKIDKYGCQMIGMSFQKDDKYLKEYNDFFERKQYSFVLKDNIKLGSGNQQIESGPGGQPMIPITPHRKPIPVIPIFSGPTGPRGPRGPRGLQGPGSAPEKPWPTSICGSRTNAPAYKYCDASFTTLGPAGCDVESDNWGGKCEWSHGSALDEQKGDTCHGSQSYCLSKTAQYSWCKEDKDCNSKNCYKPPLSASADVGIALAGIFTGGLGSIALEAVDRAAEVGWCAPKGFTQPTPSKPAPKKPWPTLTCGSTTNATAYKYCDANFTSMGKLVCNVETDHQGGQCEWSHDTSVKK